MQLRSRGDVTARAGTAARRQAILDAAMHLFATRGLRATAIEDICAASGASNGSLYHHFGSKEGIAATLYASAIEETSAELSQCSGTHSRLKQASAAASSTTSSGS